MNDVSTKPAAAGTRSKPKGGTTMKSGNRPRTGDRSVTGANGATASGAGSQSGAATVAHVASGAFAIPIEVVPMGNRGGRKAIGDEFPFDTLERASIVDGQILGPSFFIPDRMQAKTQIATARKRFYPQGKVFLTRKVKGTDPETNEANVPGVRVWLAPEDYESPAPTRGPRKGQKAKAKKAS